MKHLSVVFVLLVALVVHGDEPKSKTPAPAKYKKSVRVETNPPGLRVFVGYGADMKKAIRRAEYVGQSPCVAQVITDSRGRVDVRNTVTIYNKAVQPVLVFVARGDGTNEVETTQVFKGSALLRGADEVPDAVFLDAKKP